MLAGVSAGCKVLVGEGGRGLYALWVFDRKGGSLMVVEAKCIVPGSWMRLCFLGKWLSMRLMKHI